MKQWVIILIILSFCIISCKQNESFVNNKKIFRYNEAAGITSLDPAFAKDLSNIWACNQLFNGLVQLNDQMEVIPCIAKKWSISEDGKEYTFILRDDVYFHDAPCFKDKKGRRVTASDFKFSFNRIVDPKITSPGLWVFNAVENIENSYSFSTPNDSVFVIRLKKSFPPFLGILAMKYCSVVPHEAIQMYGVDFRKNPVGAGAFLFKLWKENKKLVFRKNPSYFEKEKGKQLPYLDAIAISFLVDKQSAFLQFIQGKLDFMSGIDASYKDELLTKTGQLKSKYSNSVQLISQPYLNTEYLGILIDEHKANVKSSPLRFKEIRQAINYGFDRKKMIKYLRNNIGEPGLNGIIPKGLPAYNDSAKYGYTYNPEKARELIKLAGYSTDKPAEISLSTNSEYLDLCKYIQHQLNQIGFDVSIDVNPPAVLREMKAQAKLNFFRASWIADYPDAENYLSMFYSKNFCPNGPNYTHFKNKEFDRLYEKSLAEIDPNKRNMLYRKMDQLIMEEAPVVILYYDQVLRFIQKNVKGLGSNAVNLLDLKRVKKI
jgi:peptide/nickel transport system substrate-binding protein